jgi:hypothetical protein
MRGLISVDSVRRRHLDEAEIEFVDSIIHCVIDLIKDLHAPRKAFGAGSRDPHLSLIIESEVP